MAAVLNQIMDLCHTHSQALSTIGALTVLYISIKVVYSLWCGLKVYVLSRTLGLTADLKSFGSWAVVTGATDGIGRAYAEELARLGLNIVLISRSADKLANVAKEIESQSGVKTKCIPIDFTESATIYETIAGEIKGMDVGVLVNNVGMSVDHPMFLTEASDKNLKDIITVNCNSVTLVTKIVLPSMVEKRKGAIINISSQSGLRCVPLLAVYSATKAYVEFFSEAIAEEYKSKGIIVQCVAPGFVATKMSKIRNTSFFAPGPDTFVKSALATFGVAQHSDGCLAHAIQGALNLSAPSWIYYKVVKSLMGGARARALKKQQKTQ